MRPATRLLLVLALLVAACGDGAGTTADDPTASVPPGSSPASASATVPDLHPSVDDWPAGTVEVVAGEGTRHRVAVRVARTPEQRAHGLMEVEELPDGAGMWFVFDEDRTGGFWMKNTLVPLDIAYVGADERIVSVAEAVPCREDPCPVYPPDAPYRNVLEVPGGYLERIGAGVGDVVRLVAR